MEVEVEVEVAVVVAAVVAVVVVVVVVVVGRVPLPAPARANAGGRKQHLLSHLQSSGSVGGPSLSRCEFHAWLWRGRFHFIIHSLR